MAQAQMEVLSEVPSEEELLKRFEALNANGECNIPNLITEISKTGRALKEISEIVKEQVDEAYNIYDDVNNDYELLLQHISDVTSTSIGVLEASQYINIEKNSKAYVEEVLNAVPEERLTAIIGLCLGIEANLKALEKELLKRKTKVDKTPLFFAAGFGGLAVIAFSLAFLPVAVPVAVGCGAAAACLAIGTAFSVSYLTDYLKAKKFSEASEQILMELNKARLNSKKALHVTRDINGTYEIIRNGSKLAVFDSDAFEEFAKTCKDSHMPNLLMHLKRLREVCFP